MLNLKQRLVSVGLMSFTMALIMSGILLFINKWYSPEFFAHWFKAFSIAFPIAFTIAFFVAPIAMKIAIKIFPNDKKD